MCIAPPPVLEQVWHTATFLEAYSALKPCHKDAKVELDASGMLTSQSIDGSGMLTSQSSIKIIPHPEIGPSAHPD